MQVYTACLTRRACSHAESRTWIPIRRMPRQRASLMRAGGMAQKVKHETAPKNRKMIHDGSPEEAKTSGLFSQAGRTVLFSCVCKHYHNMIRPPKSITDCSVLRTPTILPPFGFSWCIRPTSSSCRGTPQVLSPTCKPACVGSGLLSL